MDRKFTTGELEQRYYRLGFAQINSYQVTARRLGRIGGRSRQRLMRPRFAR